MTTTAPVRRRIPVRQPPISRPDAIEGLLYDIRAAYSRVPLATRLSGMQNFAATAALMITKRESPRVATAARNLLAAINAEAKKRQLVMPTMPKAVLK